MISKIKKAHHFKQLHKAGKPLILPNAWDVGTARAIEKSGAKAVATSSWAVAQAQGYEDGEKIPLDFVLDNVRRIVQAVCCPVSIDIEAGYGQTPVEVGKTVKKLLQTGVVGINLEDQNLHDKGKLYSISDQVQRLTHARQEADQLNMLLFINARTDVFFQNSPSGDQKEMLEEVLNRASAYKAAGADGIFVPGLIDVECIKLVCQASPLPVNLMLPSLNPEIIKRYCKLGVARISTGPLIYSNLMEQVRTLSAQLL